MNLAQHTDDGDRESGITGWGTVFAKGLFMGTADAIPGVSGGTIALITGIYERLVTAIAAIDLASVRDLLVALVHRDRGALRSEANSLDLAFLSVLATGIATAVIVVSRLLAVGLETFRAPTNAFFFGLIAASAIVLYTEISLTSPRQWLAAGLGILTAAWVTGVTAGGGFGHTLPIVFAAGIVTSSAMLLPGISGAALLYILGQYEYLIDTLHAFLGGVAGADTTTVLAEGVVTGTFLVGVAIGLATIARAVRWAIRSDRETTLTVLVSLMVGALRLPLEEVYDATTQWTLTAVGTLIIAALIGVVLVLGLDRYTDDLDYDV